MKISKYALLLALTSLLFSQANELNQPQTVNFTPLSQENKEILFKPYNEALELAKKEGKIILLELVSTDCTFCDRMEKEVLSQPQVQEAIQKDFILAKINVDYEQIPLGLSEQMTPMFVFTTVDENVEDMRLGYIEENDFLNLLEEQSKKITH
jgi:thioredoxin-related protein